MFGHPPCIFDDFFNTDDPCISAVNTCVSQVHWGVGVEYVCLSRELISGMR